MSNHAPPASRICAAALLLLALAGAAGCAAFNKCGFRGCPGDADITARVRALYAQYPALEGTNSIDIQTINHVVYLRGLVDTPFEREVAEDVASQAEGVTRVENLLGINNAR